MQIFRFEDDTIYTATGNNIKGDIINSQGKAGVINVADNIKIDGIITSTGDMSGTLNFKE
ncbi:cell surface antigen Sca3 domain protein [Rickettsia endosymbiont of Ixodes pacificus]|uniref:hypothetical protein n=1 Tax=Rickettsia endosymbiont of Ixodes pacificus TaxID=1133329 RepID=UPI0005F7C938|nr:hypothetical protein [Rickettsia endosymbiont of Ixodes pacificus]KJW02157.1 cell surface antigen Sca3 domain protein [Rickettsia endosymbiont of Ixodes pacificus]